MLAPLVSAGSYQIVNFFFAVKAVERILNIRLASPESVTPSANHAIVPSAGEHLTWIRLFVKTATSIGSQVKVFTAANAIFVDATLKMATLAATSIAYRQTRNALYSGLIFI